MDFSSFKKIENTQVMHELVDDQLVTAIVKVKKADYHPKELEVRMQIDSWLFTAQFKVSALPSLEEDSLVETISLAAPLTLL